MILSERGAGILALMERREVRQRRSSQEVKEKRERMRRRRRRRRIVLGSSDSRSGFGAIVTFFDQQLSNIKLDLSPIHLRYYLRLYALLGPSLNISLLSFGRFPATFPRFFGSPFSRAVASLAQSLTLCYKPLSTPPTLHGFPLSLARSPLSRIPRIRQENFCLISSSPLPPSSLSSLYPCLLLTPHQI